MFNTHSYISIYSKDFHSFDLNKQKYENLVYKAKLILEFRNKISNNIYVNINQTLNLSKYQAIKLYNQSAFGLLGQDVQNVIDDVHTCYNNKFNTIFEDKLVFKIQNKLIVTYYKKQTTVNNKTFNKGDVKTCCVSLTETTVSSYLDYFIKFNSVNDALDFIYKKYKTASGDLKLFYDNLTNFVIKVGESRIESLINNKKQRLVEKYNKLIEFKSLSYRTTSRLVTDFVGKNKNKYSKVEYFLNIGGCYLGKKKDKGNNTVPVSGTIVIPIEYNKKYHGSSELYNKEVGKGKPQNISYTLQPLKKQRVRVILTHKGERNVYSDGNSIVGVDVNVKHNMLSLADGTIYDYERKLLDKYIKFLHHLDKVKENKSKLGLTQKQVSKVSVKNTNTLHNYQNKFKHSLERVCSKFVKDMKQQGYNHIVMEDLEQSAKMFSNSEEFDGINYGRLFRLLHIADIKNIIESICYKNEMTLSVVHPHYTSKQCSQCGTIHDDNRKSQEIFECVSCGFKVGADINAPINIKKQSCIRCSKTALKKEQARRVTT
jgi:IS605 OrfB family transposase